MNRAVSVPSILKLASLAALLALPLRAAEAPAAAAPLTLEECVRRAVAQNFDVQAGQFTRDNATHTLTISRSAFDPTLSASAQASGARSAGGTHTDSLDGRVGVSQRLATGGTVGVSTRLDRGGSSLYDPVYSSDLTVSLSQPLLKGAGTATNLAGIERAKIGVARAGLDYRATLMDVVQDTEVAYYQLAFARKQLDVRKLSLAAAERLWEENKTKYQTGVLTELDVLTAEVNVATQRRNVILAQQQVRDREDGLKALVGQFELDQLVGEVTSIEPDVVALDVVATFDRARAAQPEYLSFQSSIEQSKLDLLTAKSATRPSLDANGAFGFNTDETSAGRAISQLPGSEARSWQVGLTLTYPWGQRGDKARLHVAENNLQQQSLRLRQLEQSLMVQARSAVRSVETNREAVTVAAFAAKLAERQYEAERDRYSAGQSTARRVLDAQTDLDNARVNELSSKTTLLQSLAVIRRLEGRTLETYGIKLE